MQKRSIVALAALAALVVNVELYHNSKVEHKRHHGIICLSAKITKVEFCRVWHTIMWGHRLSCGIITSPSDEDISTLLAERAYLLSCGITFSIG